MKSFQFNVVVHKYIKGCPEFELISYIFFAIVQKSCFGMKNECVKNSLALHNIFYRHNKVEVFHRVAKVGCPEFELLLYYFFFFAIVMESYLGMS